MRKSLFILLIMLQTVCLGQKREMRAAWIATVANIDWPSQQAVGNSELQQAEMLSILDRLQQLHFNCIIFQVRPTADAFYYSQLEPLSYWLTGTQGKDNDRPYDVLQFVVEEAHKRCLDVHVWLNPYRATHTFTTEDLDSLHIMRQHPEWFKQYGDKWYFDPGLDNTRQWLNQVVADIVTRYDIDAIHFDDYFYPYRIGKKDFPDDDTFRQYPRGYTDKNDWRRHNVDMVIEELQTTIKKIKPWVEFGISPFGVWRNSSSDPERGSQTKAGIQNYDDLYADILLWLQKGWIDYVAPQLYWEIGKKIADYEILAHWWAENSSGKNLYIGHFVSQLENPKAPAAWHQPNEICRQLDLNKTIEQIDGSMMYSVAPMLRNPLGITDSLSVRYQYHALPPANRNLRGSIALPPRKVWKEGKILRWERTYLPQTVRYYVVYGFPYGEKVDFDNPRNIIGITHSEQLQIDEPERYQAICVTAINQYKQESLPCILENLTY